eukprot:contig_15117_g3626
MYLPRSSHLSFFREVDMSAAKVNAEEADNLLKSTFEVPAANRNDKPSTKELKPWLGKALNNVHFNLRKSIIKAWSAAVDYDGTKEQALSYLKGRGYLKGPVRMGLEADCMDLLPSGKRASETILHGGVLVAGRKVWAEELT